MKKTTLTFVCALYLFTAAAQNDYLQNDSELPQRTQPVPVSEQPLPLAQPGIAAELLTGLNRYTRLQPFAVINGSGILNYIPKFTPSGIEIGNSQIFDNGTNIGIGTAVPGYKMDILHGGINGIRVRSTTGLSAVDVQAANGEAHVRFLRASVMHWQIGNNITDNSFIINETGSGLRLFIQDATGNLGIGTVTPTSKLHVVGTITSTGPKAFTIDHPLDPENKLLRHFAIESNEVLNSYSGNVVTNEKGIGIVQLPAYFEQINKDFRYQLTVIGSFARAIVSREINNNTFEIATDQPNVKVSWEVKAVRNDMYMQKTKTIAEEDKPANLKGKYFSYEAYGLPESRGTNGQPVNAVQMPEEDAAGTITHTGSRTAKKESAPK